MGADLAKLDRKIERGVENLLLADPADVPQAQQLLSKWRGQRAALQAAAEAQAAKPGHDSGSIEEAVQQAIAQLERLGQRIGHADPGVAREAFKALFRSVTLLWHPKEGHRYPLARAVIQSNPRFSMTAGNRT